MELLNAIINDSVDDTVRLPVVLRKCLVLATNLKNARLKSWTLSELNGYDDRDDLPPYRIRQIVAKGDFSGPFSRQLNSYPIPASLIEEDFRRWAHTAHMMQGVSAYEDLVRNAEDGGVVAVEWPPDLVVLHQQKILADKDWALTIGDVRVLVDSVRNKILELVLELKGDDDTSLKDLESNKVDQAVTNIIFGGHNVIGSSISGDLAQTSNNNINPGDFTLLARRLGEVGLQDADIDTLKEAINEDKSTEDTEGIGKRTLAWIAQAASKIGSLGANAAGGATKTVLTKYIVEYLGLK